MLLPGAATPSEEQAYRDTPHAHRGAARTDAKWGLCRREEKSDGTHCKKNLNPVFYARSICHTNDNYFQQEALRWGSGEDNQE